MNTLITDEARKVLVHGLMDHSFYKVVGSGEVPHEPYYKDEWWFEPLTAGAIIPSEATRRLESLKKAGIRIRGVVIAHEAPKLLSAPKETPKPAMKSDDTLPSLLPVLGTIVMALGAVFTVLGLLFFRAVLLDPALIVVLEDGNGTWISIADWREL